MRFFYTEHFQGNYKNALVLVQKAFAKQIRLLEMNMRHPSLRAKKYDEGNAIWQARVNRDWRFYFTLYQDVVTLLDIQSYPK